MLDRGLYRPNEKVHIKGYIRVMNFKVKEVYESFSLPPQQKIKYQLLDSQKLQVLNGELELNEYGSFHLELQLPPDKLNLGTASLNFTIDKPCNSSFAHRFEVQEV